MKVLKQGRKQKGPSWELTCTGKGFPGRGCGSLLLVEKGDLKNGKNYDYGGGYEVYTYFVCCYCETKTEVSQKELNNEIWTDETEDR